LKKTCCEPYAKLDFFYSLADLESLHFRFRPKYPLLSCDSGALRRHLDCDDANCAVMFGYGCTRFSVQCSVFSGTCYSRANEGGRRRDMFHVVLNFCPACDSGTSTSLFHSPCQFLSAGRRRVLFRAMRPSLELECSTCGGGCIWRAVCIPEMQPGANVLSFSLCVYAPCKFNQFALSLSLWRVNS